MCGTGIWVNSFYSFLTHRLFQVASIPGGFGWFETQPSSRSIREVKMTTTAALYGAKQKFIERTECFGNIKATFFLQILGINVNS